MGEIIKALNSDTFSLVLKHTIGDNPYTYRTCKLVSREWRAHIIKHKTSVVSDKLFHFALHAVDGDVDQINKCAAAHYGNKELLHPITGSTLGMCVGACAYPRDVASWHSVPCIFGPFMTYAMKGATPEVMSKFLTEVAFAEVFDTIATEHMLTRMAFHGNKPMLKWFLSMIPFNCDTKYAIIHRSQEKLLSINYDDSAWDLADIVDETAITTDFVGMMATLVRPGWHVEFMDKVVNRFIGRGSASTPPTRLRRLTSLCINMGQPLIVTRWIAQFIDSIDEFNEPCNPNDLFWILDHMMRDLDHTKKFVEKIVPCIAATREYMKANKTDSDPCLAAQQYYKNLFDHNFDGTKVLENSNSKCFEIFEWVFSRDFPLNRVLPNSRVLVSDSLKGWCATAFRVYLESRDNRDPIRKRKRGKKSKN